MPTERGPELGRWTLWPCPECADVIGRCNHDSRRRPVPAVPCDEAAVERAAAALYEIAVREEAEGRNPHALWDEGRYHDRATATLRAAGEGGER